ncbi:hypothetical protein LINPERPRIM_LOCUS42662 [Linum perenne]
MRVSSHSTQTIPGFLRMLQQLLVVSFAMIAVTLLKLSVLMWKIALSQEQS